MRLSRGKARRDAAIGLAILFVSPLIGRLLWYVSEGRWAFPGMAATAFLGLLLCSRALVLGRRRHDPYSLEALREIEEQERNRPEETDLSEKGGQLCHTCGEVYGPEYNACPRCGRSF